MNPPHDNRAGFLTFEELRAVCSITQAVMEAHQQGPTADSKNKHSHGGTQ